MLIGGQPVLAKEAKVDGVTLNIPDKFKTSKSSRGIKLQTADKEVIVWLETYKGAEKSKVMGEYDDYWKENDVVLNDAKTQDINESGGVKQEVTNFQNATWQGDPTVVRYISVGPSPADGKMILFTIWASPEGFKKYGKDVLSILETADLGPKAATTAPSSAPASASQPPATATVADLEAQENATAAVWERLPFSARHVMFVARKATAYGDYEARSSNVFAPGEKLLTYLEPLGYAWTANGDTYRIGVSVDFEVLSTTGKILGGQKEILKQKLETHYRNREFYINSTMDIDGATAGDYVLVYTLHDLANGHTTRLEQPFTIKGTAAEAK
jgi:hypothetical protein